MIKKFSVGGMTCSNCSQGIEKYISSLNGIKSVSVSLLLKEMTVDFDSSIISAEEIISAVERLGYTADFYNLNKIDKYSEAKKLKKRFFISLILLLPLMYFSMGVMFGLPGFDKKINFIIQGVFAVSIIAINFKFYINGVKAVLHLSPNMDTLVSLGSFSAFVYSVVMTILLFVGVQVEHVFYEASAMVLALVTLGKWLEELSKVKTGDAIDKLNKLMPKTATVLKDGKMVTVLTSEIEVGDTVVLRIGDYVPIDGVIVEGTASIDKSVITGESLPEEVKVDDFIGSGSIIKDGFLMVEAIQVGGDTMFSKIVEIVKTAGASKAPIQRIADKVAGVFVPVVTLIAIITFTLWASITGDLYNAFNYGISVLVISCPCSLGLATPVAIMASTGKSASLGVLFKDAGAIQNTCKINCVLLDKTATITVGKPKVTDFLNLSDMDNKAVYRIVSALEIKSSHPLAECIFDFCGQSELNVENYEYIVGKGAKGIVDGETYYIGNSELLPDVVKVSLQEREEFFGKTVIYFSNSSKLLAIFAVADYLKEDSFEAIKTLKDSGIKTVMVTGDAESVANRVAKEVGIDTYEAQVLPEDKYRIVEKYKNEGYFVAMVGDGINDSPALKSADIGIAMGTGTDIAIDSSDIVLVNGSLKGLGNAIEISKKSVKIIKENLFWAFFYNVVAIPVAAGALSFVGFVLTPIIASACMSLSSLFVVTNALRISRKKKEKSNKNKKRVKVNYIYTIYIEGMSCGHCTDKVEKALSKLDGVIKVSANLKNKTATVESEIEIAEEVFDKTITEIGFVFKKVEQD